MYVGNVMLLILNLPLVGLWVRMLKIPYGILFAVILAFMVIGSYSIKNTTFDVVVMAIFGVLGYMLRKLDFPLAPAVLTLILGPLMEKSLRQALELSQGDFSTLVASPISAVLLAIAGFVLISSPLRLALEEGEFCLEKLRLFQGHGWQERRGLRVSAGEKGQRTERYEQ